MPPNAHDHIQSRSRALTNRPARYNRFMDKMSNSPVVLKIPMDVSADEENVLFGLGTVTVGAGATGQFNVAAPRDLILRKLSIVDMADAANGNHLVVAVSVEGKALLQGLGAAGAAFLPGQFDKPSFDCPAGSGTPITVSVQNITGGALTYGGFFTID
jgi:hypothetical protein